MGCVQSRDSTSQDWNSAYHELSQKAVTEEGEITRRLTVSGYTHPVKAASASVKKKDNQVLG